MTTEIDLTPIKDRLARARHLPVFLTEGDIAKARENRKSLYRWHLEGTWDDAVLFGRARDDIAALVAEVERLREGYSSRVLDQVDQKTQLTDSSGYFIGPVTVEAEGAPGDWDVVFRFGADTFKLRQSDAVALDIDAQTAIYDGPDTYEEDLDAARKARIEEDKDF